ncbi:peptidoglycan-associated lipoprotein Pal [Sphingomonas lenta]|uniref:Peptidoglycan-associated lipoprotein n=1 Tax=Sphingomonas lenta TaxID=1141887 RepID=A0A2A2SCI4_9SPHN|nr:peptidoglycan-associated lipoprotein Pal [Sphingomonas lenta]PAX06923.1 peptidoglycan-associated lipoprotein [Sphingomonas lenta]
MTRTITLIAATALLSLGACAKKRPEVLPPAPVGSGADAGAGVADPNAAGGAVVPGSDADFQRSVTSNTILFALDQYDIDAQARSILDSQVEWLNRYPNVRITIEGHADERGTREYNLGLGDRRANAAKNYLAARGVSPARISVISYGKERPVALGSDEGSWARNRRAVTVIIGQ